MLKETVKKILPSWFLSFYHLLLVFLGAFLFSFPSKRMKIIGVTGTNGKSTVVDLITRILDGSGFKTASISSIRFKIIDKEWKNTLKMTMPGRISLQKFLYQAKKANCDYVVLEVTSEGIKQHRHRFIHFDTLLFTNLTPEHIEAHGSFEKYRGEKLKLFKALIASKKKKKTIIVNLDDDNSSYFLDFPVDEKWGYFLEKENSEKELNLVKPESIHLNELNSSFVFRGKQFNLKLSGKFNILNALAALCLALSEKISLDKIKESLEKARLIPGRMEVVVKNSFTVIVDYAHTPVALENVYQTVLSNNPKRVICILGSCGGGRDKWKRPEMGKIADKYCQKIILTNEDPYDEAPKKILEDLEKGISSQAEIILDRREAIRKALRLAKENDFIVITGKGSEPWMCVAGGKKISWDDRKIVKEEFDELKLEKNGRV